MRSLGRAGGRSRAIGAALAWLLYALLSLPATARAQPGARAGVEVVAETPAGCPDAAAIDRMLVDLLGPSKSTGDWLRASIAIREVEAPELELTLTTETASGSEVRKLRSASCQTLSETAALFIAIVHDPAVDTSRVALGAPANAPERVVVAPPPPLPRTPPPPPPLPARAPKQSILGLAVAAWGGGAGLDFPSIHGLFGATLALRLEAFRLEGGFDLSTGSSAELASDTSKGADLSLRFGSFHVCRTLAPFFDATWPVPVLEPRFAACVGLEAGAISGEGFGVRTTTSGTAPWVAPRIELRGGLGLVGPLSVWGRAALAIPVDRRRFVFSASETTDLAVVHEVGPVAIRIQIGPELGF